MDIRPAKPDDFEAIEAVARATWHDTYDDLEADVIDETVDDWYTDDSMPLEAPGTVVLVAERAGPRSTSSRTESSEDDEIVAFTHAVAQGDAADVLRMYVHPDYQGDGIGTELHERLLAELEAYDIERVRSIDFAFNDASRRFYEGLGFEQTDTGEVVIDGESYDEAMYTLEL
ncbi:GNAT family N-acetyltransferase [Natrarchaeobaculum sulfurireducens]|uniref:Acetyltransferase (GNAT) family n=1 Tax=Natrarchaeobaculum sulfurireducens TaxID=2044521 RepID=A0A346PJ07_9EURY|nr:GNAT family N-acetyltransferase [Natrarchaeobaculum sulfurireducens]AXR79502.1 Acetyltransferase (GNAT) family [Natrarchaeobaculum sulfurireducens]